MKRIVSFTLLFFLLLLNVAYAADVSQSSQKSIECNYNEYDLKISKLNQTISNLTEELNYYRNLSNFYKELYENKNANLTNKQIIEINNNLTQINNNLTVINQNITNLYQKINQIFIGVIIEVTLIGIVVAALIKIRNVFIKKKDEQQIQK